MILITGATGTNGREIIRQMMAAGQKVRAMVRKPEQAREFAELGMETVVGDLGASETLPAALQGVDKALLLTPVHERHVRWVGHFIRAARNVHVVKLSGMGADRSAPSVLLRQHAETDDMLVASGLPYTLLRPNSFYQNLLWNAGTIQSQDTFYMSMKSAAQSMVDVRDVAAVAVQALTGPGHEGKTYVITGPEAITCHAIAVRLTKVLGRPIRYFPVPSSATRDAILNSGAPAWNANAVAEIMKYFASGRAAQVTNTVQQVTGYAARGFEAFARDHAGAFTPAAKVV